MNVTERRARTRSDPIRGRRPEGGVAEELERHDRLRGPRLDEREEREQRDAGGQRGEHPRRVPGVARPAEARVEDDPRQPHREHERAEPVDPAPLRHLPRLEDARDHRQRDEAERKVDVEDPAPGEVVDEEAAEQRPGDDRDAEDAAEQALVAAALARRDDVPDDRHRDDDQAAAAEPLHRSEDDQLQHAPGEPAQRGAARNSTSAPWRTRLRPYMSPSFP